MVNMDRKALVPYSWIGNRRVVTYGKKERKKDLVVKNESV